MTGMIWQKVLNFPELETYRNFEGQKVVVLPKHGKVKVQGRLGTVYEVLLSRKTKYDEDLVKHPTQLVAKIDTDNNPWKVLEIRRGSL